MRNKAIITAAGWGKTTHLASKAYSYEKGKLALVTYTTNNVKEINNKLYSLDRALPPHVEVWSWYRFLLREMARPYQRALLDRRVDSISWVDGRSVRYVPRRRTDQFFMTTDGRIYSDKISRFVIECNTATGGAVMARLEDRFRAIFIDEIQDMAGYDLDLIELMLRSNIQLLMAGDHRQATYSTNNAARNKSFAGANIINKFRDWEDAELLTIEYGQETHRCHQLIADLADSFYRDEPKTISRSTVATDHDGVFLISNKDVPEYTARYRPQVLRLDRRTSCNGYFSMNFGEVKGMTFDRVLIFPHKKCREWLASGNYEYVSGSAAKMYVGITRARHSVAFVFDQRSSVAGVIRYG